MRTDLLFAEWGELHLLAERAVMRVGAVAVVLCLWVFASILTGCGRHSASGGRAAPQPTVSGANLKNGKAVYERECAACHGQYGVSGPIGPSLKGERTRRKFDAVRAIVADPQPPMPKLYPARLTKADLTDVSAYVESL